jgi:hypothetical protein
VPLSPAPATITRLVKAAGIASARSTTIAPGIVRVTVAPSLRRTAQAALIQAGYDVTSSEGSGYGWVTVALPEDDLGPSVDDPRDEPAPLDAREVVVPDAPQGDDSTVIVVDGFRPHVDTTVRCLGCGQLITVNSEGDTECGGAGEGTCDALDGHAGPVEDSHHDAADAAHDALLGWQLAEEEAEANPTTVEPAPEVAAAAERVEAFLASRSRSRGLDQELLLAHNLHELRASDLRTLIAALDRP